MTRFFSDEIRSQRAQNLEPSRSEPENFQNISSQWVRSFIGAYNHCRLLPTLPSRESQSRCITHPLMVGDGVWILDDGVWILDAGSQRDAPGIWKIL